MAEVLTLTTPINITSYSVRGVAMDRDEPYLKIKIKDSNGVISNHTYKGDVALTFINQINKANLSISTLERRILERLVSDGELDAGTVGGTPD